MCYRGKKALSFGDVSWKGLLALLCLALHRASHQKDSLLLCICLVVTCFKQMDGSLSLYVPVLVFFSVMHDGV